MIHVMCCGSSPSMAVPSPPKGFSLLQRSTRTYSMQCSGILGVCAMVQRGKLTWTF